MTIYYDSIELFYADRGGERSPEADYGAYHDWDIGPWTQVYQSLPAYRRCRVAVVAHTGDVYAESSIGGHVALLGTVPHGPAGRVIPLGQCCTGCSKPIREPGDRCQCVQAWLHADHILEGWAHGGKPLTWFLACLGQEPDPLDGPHGSHRADGPASWLGIDL